MAAWRLGAMAIRLAAIAFVVSVSSWSVAVASPATPQPPTDGGAHSGSVLIVVAASDPEASALFDALRELLGRIGIGLRAARRQAPVEDSKTDMWIEPTMLTGEDLAGVAIDARSTDRVRIIAYAVGKSGVVPAMDRTLPRTNSSAIVVEQVAHAVYTTLESMLPVPRPDQAREMSPATDSVAAQPPTAEPLDEAKVRPVSQPTLRLDGAAFASLREVASGVGPSTGGGGALDIGLFRSPFRSSVWLAASLDAAFDVSGAEATLETSIASFRAIPSAQLFTAGILRLDVGAGAGIDLFHTTPRDASRPSVKLSPDTTIVDPVLTGQLVTRTNVAGLACLLVGVSLDYDLGVHRYTTVDRLGNEDSVLLPWRLRPSAILGLWIPLAGATVCATPG